MNQNQFPTMTIGTVALTVANLDDSLAYYQEHIGLRLHRREDDVAYLGVGGADLLRLEEKRGARKAFGTTGLYHYALLLPSRTDLAFTLRHFAEKQTMLSGMSDHAVSEAIYLSDPDGHGIEIYRDRPHEEWVWEDGRLKMTVDPLDVASLFDSLLHVPQQTWQGLPAGTVMGHMHLHVASIPEAEQFYRDILGFDLVARYGAGASFLSTGGYHHHLGVNTWNGVGAPPPSPDDLGLQWYEIRVTAVHLPHLLQRLDNAAIPVTQSAQGWHLTDPSGNGIVLVQGN
ncbi:MAG: VOC family protein [Ardenticatenaceae bacterium]|nr:VOC family protein [Ardenticatenaceae bacterium]